MQFVSEKVLKWYHVKIVEAGFFTPDELKVSDLLVDGSKAHETVYLHLRQAIDRHLSEHHNQNPRLELLEFPLKRYKWKPNNDDIQRQLREMLPLNREEFISGSSDVTEDEFKN